MIGRALLRRRGLAGRRGCCSARTGGYRAPRIRLPGALHAGPQTPRMPLCRPPVQARPPAPAILREPGWQVRAHAIPAAPQEPARRARLLTPSCAPWRRPADPLSGAVVAAAVRAVACVALAAALPVGPAEPPWAGGALLDAGLSCCAAVLMRLSPAALWRWGVPACLALHAAASAPKARACALI